MEQSVGPAKVVTKTAAITMNTAVHISIEIRVDFLAKGFYHKRPVAANRKVVSLLELRHLIRCARQTPVVRIGGDPAKKLVS
jgi:hypothetical protein